MHHMRELKMKIYLTYTTDLKSFAKEIVDTLTKSGYLVSEISNLDVGESFDEAVMTEISEADVFIPLISKRWPYGFRSTELSIAIALKKRIIPVVIGDSSLIPEPLINRICLIVPYKELDNSFECVIDEFERKSAIARISASLVYIKAEEEEEQHKKEVSEKRVQDGLSTYLQDTMTRLIGNEKTNKRMAFIFYFLSILSLFSAIVISVYVAKNNSVLSQSFESLCINVAFSVLVVIMFISISKLMFTLARSFMVESIRCADRIHAISFGKFFLDAFGKEATRDEVLRAFSTWNIDDGKTSFRNQSGEDFDPKLEHYLSAFKNRNK